MLPLGQAVTARSLLGGVFGRLRGFGPPAPAAAPTATSIAVSPNGASIGLAQTQQLSATILDQYGQPFSGTVSWSTSNAAVATVNASGVVTPVAYGSVTITATFNALSTDVTLTVQQPTQVAITTQPGNGVTGSALSTQPVLRLRDANGVNVAESGRVVSVSVASGNGVLTGVTSVATDNNGVATFVNVAIEATSPPASFTLAFSSTGLTGATGASITVTTGQVTPTADETFAQYANTAAFEADPNDWYNPPSALTVPGSRTIDTSEGFGGSDRCLLYTFGARGSGSCANGGFGWPMRIIGAPSEVWVEVVAKYSANWSSGDPACSNFDHKFLFLLGNGASRFNVNVGVFNVAWRWGYPGNESYLTDTNPALYPMPFDGQWHTYRMHVRVGSGPGTDFARFRFDDQYIVDYFGKDTNVEGLTINWTQVQTLQLGSTLNSGPVNEQYLRFGRIRQWTTDPGWGW